MLTGKLANKREVSMNIEKALWRKARMAAAEKDTTLTALVEHLLRVELDTCKHDKLVA
jgi:hypothetical protein